MAHWASIWREELIDVLIVLKELSHGFRVRAPLYVII